MPYDSGQELVKKRHRQLSSIECQTEGYWFESNAATIAKLKLTDVRSLDHAHVIPSVSYATHTLASVSSN